MGTNRIRWGLIWASLLAAFGGPLAAQQFIRSIAMGAWPDGSDPIIFPRLDVLEDATEMALPSSWSATSTTAARLVAASRGG